MMRSRLRGYHGIDIGGTKIELVAFHDDEHGLREVHRERIPTPGTDFAEFVQSMQALVARADVELDMRAAVGIGLPGVVDTVSGRQLSSNVPALNGRVVASALQEALQRPLVIGNDCQCFALSEADGGAAHALPSMFGAIIGTGAGGGYCVNGRLLRGANGIAGEWGHWPMPAALLQQYQLPLLPCACGRSGCMERYVSGPGMSQLHRHLGGDGAPPHAIAAQAAAGSQLAQQTLALHLDLLAHALATLVITLDPHAIVLGGGLSQMSHLYQQLPAAVKRHLFTGVIVPPILPPAYGDAGGARGAALLARQLYP
ncbi:ROK family protein [Pseudoduganella danionis]|uniref:ROK family protein n=1 Tax=Pseudoduganella danionis TaxID=1890295 RepID=UPI0035B33047